MARRGPLSDIQGFFAAPAQRRRLAMEAARALIVARWATLGRGRGYARFLGTPVAEAPEPDGPASPEAVEIGRMVARVARVMPFRVKCLQEALAVRRMLARRGLASVLCLGLNRDGGARASGEAAHAWVVCAGRVVAGDDALERFAVVGRFV